MFFMSRVFSWKPSTFCEWTHKRIDCGERAVLSKDGSHSAFCPPLHRKQWKKSRFSIAVTGQLAHPIPARKRYCSNKEFLPSICETWSGKFSLQTMRCITPGCFENLKSSIFCWNPPEPFCFSSFHLQVVMRWRGPFSQGLPALLWSAWSRPAPKPSLH